MSARASWLLLALVLATPSLAAEEGEVAEVEKDRVSPLKQRVPPVSGTFFLKQGRLEIAPSTGISFKDSFFHKNAFGLEIAQHFHETVAVGARGSFALNSQARAMQICLPSEDAQTESSCHYASMAELDGRAPGQLLFLAGVNLQWSPLYGKVSLFALGFPNFDLYLLFGADLVGYKGPSDAPGSVLHLSPGGEVALGTRLFLTNWLALRFELRDLVYFESVKRLGVTNAALRQQFFFQLGFSIFLSSPSGGTGS
jgi:outer membrane beta-barrel protein